ncbi:hypothetical protein B0X78_18690 [bacterium AM6]|nr:hypothetical protein B0X78_18690 [bacterium AM6]
MPRLGQHQIAFWCLVEISVQDDDLRTTLQAAGGDLDGCVGCTCIRIVHIHRRGVRLLEIAERLESLMKRK